MATLLRYLIIFIDLTLSKISGETAILHGDFHIAGLFQIYTDEQCSREVDEMSVRNFEAVKWTIKKLNEANYVPGLKLGLEGFPTCNVPGRALEHAIQIIRKRKSSDAMDAPFLGLIGPEFSHEAMDTSSYISSLGKNNLMLQILFSATASALSNGFKYQNILRVIPEDSKQSSVIVSLMESLSWNYIGVVYENNSYGIGNFEELKKLTKTKKICIAFQSSVSVKNGLVSTDEITTIVESLIYHSVKESKILGVVIFASTNTAESILKVANKIKENNDFQLGMIFSEGSSDVGITTLNRTLISKGSFFISPPWLQFKSYKTHWLDVLTNKTVFAEEVTSNPWLKLVLKKFISCDVQDASCSMPDREKIIVEPNVFEGYAILALALQAQILKDLQRVSCGTNSGLCQEFNNTLSEKAYTLVDKGRETQVNVNSMPIDSGLSMNIHFDDLVEATMTGNVSEYEVYHFRNCIKKGNDVCLEKVGDYNNSSLTLNKEKLRDYTRNADGLAWPDIIRAQCDPGKLCRSCLNENLPNEILFKKGDLYVTAVVPVYNKDTADPLKCGNIRKANGWEVVEGIRFAVETVNKKNGIFKNYFRSKTLGYVILNGCNQPLHAQSIILKLFTEGIQLSDGSRISDIRNKTLGFVAAYGSSVSLATASVLQEVKFPQISYASTAAVLSDRTSYRYFLRTCTPDDKQALAMLNIVKTLNSSYIQIMYSEGTYGEGGRNAIVNAAKESKICVANEIKVKENDYKRIRDYLLKTPYATIILLFLKFHVINDVLKELHETIEQWSYIFIGSEAFGTRKDIITQRPKLEGTISLSLQMDPLTGISKFEKYLYDRLVNRGSDINPWTREYFEERNGCYMSGSFNKMFASQCSDIAEEFNSKDYQPEIWTSFAINAVFSLLQGSNIAFNVLCGTQSSSLCKQYRDDPDTVYDCIKNQRMVIDYSMLPSKVFNENGDGNIGYKIYQVQNTPRNTSQLTYKEIGRYMLEKDGYSIHEHLIQDPHKALPSKCPNPVECQKCSNKISIQTNAPSESGNVITIISGTVLGVSIIALIVIVVLVKVLRWCRDTTDMLYLDPVFLHEQSHSETDNNADAVMNFDLSIEQSTIDTNSSTYAEINSEFSIEQSPTVTDNSACIDMNSDFSNEQRSTDTDNSADAEMVSTFSNEQKSMDTNNSAYAEMNSDFSDEQSPTDTDNSACADMNSDFSNEQRSTDTDNSAYAEMVSSFSNERRSTNTNNSAYADVNSDFSDEQSPTVTDNSACIDMNSDFSNEQRSTDTDNSAYAEMVSTFSNEQKSMDTNNSAYAEMNSDFSDEQSPTDTDNSACADMNSDFSNEQMSTDTNNSTHAEMNFDFSTEQSHSDADNNAYADVNSDFSNELSHSDSDNSAYAEMNSDFQSEQTFPNSDNSAYAEMVSTCF